MSASTTAPATLPRRRLKGRYAQRLRVNVKPAPAKLRGLPRLWTVVTREPGAWCGVKEDE